MPDQELFHFPDSPIYGDTRNNKKQKYKRKNKRKPRFNGHNYIMSWAHRGKNAPNNSMLSKSTNGNAVNRLANKMEINSYFLVLKNADVNGCYLNNFNLKCRNFWHMN